MKSKEKIISLVIAAIMVFSTVSIIASNKAQASNGTTLYVGGSGLGNYTTIQSAVDNASEGDIIYIYNGVYQEIVRIRKDDINLVGENKYETIIDANEGYKGICIAYCNYISVSNLTVRNALNAGIQISAHGPASHPSNYNTISNCIVRDCKSNTVYPNHAGSGILIYGHRHRCYADYNTIINCTLYNNSCAGCFIRSGDSSSSASYNKILNSNIHDNYIGVALGSQNDLGMIEGNILSNCEIFNNNGFGIVVDPGNDEYKNLFYHNNICNNSLNAFDDVTNNWYNETLREGNYWSNFDESSEEAWDNNSDGIADNPYNIFGGINQDNYPLIFPFGAAKTIVSVEPSKKNVQGNEIFAIDIKVEPSEPVAGVQFDFSFDSSLLMCDSITEGNLFEGYDTYFDKDAIDNINGTITDVVGLTFLGNTSSAGIFATLSFTSMMKDGISFLNLSRVVVGDPNASAIPILVNQDTIRIKPHKDWDINKDNQTNILDLIIIGQNWEDIGPPGWIRADSNKDGVVNILDMILVGQHWTE